METLVIFVSFIFRTEEEWIFEPSRNGAMVSTQWLVIKSRAVTFKWAVLSEDMIVLLPATLGALFVANPAIFFCIGTLRFCNTLLAYLYKCTSVMVHLIGIKATNSPIILNSIQQMLTGNFLREEDD
jgi:ABC-type multidrug transport system permease subunit